MINNNKQYERYQQQIALKEFGIGAQQKLLKAKALVVGAGGLGCPVLQYLVAAGVGTVGIVDDDVVSLTNLHRQVLYSVDDIGLLKAVVAANKLRRLNNEINIISHTERLTNKNALSIIDVYNIIINCTDNFSSCYMINDACVLQNKPLIYGAVSKFEGQAAVLNAKMNEEERGVNYRDIFLTPPKDDEIFNCSEDGVLGVVTGIIGTLQANEAIKLITGIGKCLINKLITYNALDNNVYKLNLSINQEADAYIPKDEEAFLKMDYDWLCSSQPNNELEIDDVEFNKLITDENTTIVDVREKDELPLINEFEHLQISLSELTGSQSKIDKNNIVVFCQSGKRSLQAAKLLRNALDRSRKIYSLKNGIAEWKYKHALQVMKM